MALSYVEGEAFVDFWIEDAPVAFPVEGDLVGSPDLPFDFEVGRKAVLDEEGFAEKVRGPAALVYDSQTFPHLKH